MSELVANAVVHGSRRPTDTLKVMVWTSPASIRVAVRDRGDSFTAPPPPSAQQLAPRGWGLYLLERLADRWGISRRPNTEVWFEINADSPRAPAVNAHA